MNIDHHISELLYQYDCVVIPGFGGFVANYSPAKIHPTRHTFSPPSKNISFNKNLTNNDGLLAHHIGAEGVTYPEANGIIESFVETCNKDMKTGKRVEIKNIGAFYYDAEHNIQFEPDQSINYLMDSFGLTSFQSPAIKRENIEEKLEKQFKDRPPIASGLKKSIRSTRYKKYRIALLALPFIFLLIWLPLKTNFFDDLSFNYSGLNPFGGKGEGEPTHWQSADGSPPAYNFVRAGQQSAVGNKNSGPSPAGTVDTSAGSTKPLTEILPEVAATTVSTVSEVGRYHVIGGCFKNLNNAKRLVRKLKKQGYEAQIAGQNNTGLYRVSYGAYVNRKDALEELAGVRVKHIPTAWLFVM